MTDLIGKNRRFFRRVNFLANLLKPDSLDLDNILVLSIVLARSSAAAPMIRLLKENKDMKIILKDRWRPSPVDLEKLQILPPQSLGHLYAQHMIDNKIGAMKYDDPVTSDADYIVHRLRETHDILHTLLGCGVDPEGELQTQAFCIFNLRSPLNVVLAVVLLFRLFYSETPLEQAVNSFTKGAQQGIKAKNLLASKFEEGWDRPIDDWRKELCIEL
jgi:ubiquinone biosynthesis protein Coq4